MITSIVGGAVGALGGLFGGLSKNKAIRSQLAAVAQQQRDNQDWYDRRYNEDATQRADAQRILTRTEEILRNRNKAAAARQAVMGGTDESVAAEKAAGNQALADATSQIAASAEQRKNQIENQYLNRKAALDQQAAALKGQKVNGWDMANNIIGGAAEGLTNIL